jgi:membrane-bound ClpP family serine protease
VSFIGEGPLTQRHSTRGAWLIMLASLITMAICVYDYYTPETGLIGTGGVITVAVAGLLMLLASLTMGLVANRSSFLQGFLVVSILLDIIGSSVAGYFLESPVIMAAQALALIGWLINVIGDAAERSVEIDEVEDED